MAATESSSPASSGTTTSATAASGEDGSLVIATLGRPWSRAAASTATMSGERPDCEIAERRAASQERRALAGEQ